jgi:hypothetical protein
MTLERPFLLLDHNQSSGINRVPITKYQSSKPKDGKDYTWRRVRKGEWTRVSTLPPDELFPADALISEEKHEINQRSSGSMVAHMSEKYED